MLKRKMALMEKMGLSADDDSEDKDAKPSRAAKR
jgi:ribosome assembly protein YihI (activator of Der GTPase)